MEKMKYLKKRMMQVPNLTIGTFRPAECSRWLKVKLDIVIKLFSLKNGVIETEKKIITKVK